MFFRFLGCLLSLFCVPHSIKAEPLAVAADAPKLDVVLHDGSKLNLGSAYEAGTVLVYFYPKADTPGCTAQACSLRDAFATLGEKGVRVFGASGDKPEKQAAFREKYNLPFDLIADDQGKLMNAFGVPNIANISARQAFLIRDGKIIWRDTKASTEKQAQDVLAALSSLSAAN